MRRKEFIKKKLDIIKITELRIRKYKKVYFSFLLDMYE